MNNQSVSIGNDQNNFSTSILFIVFNRPQTTKRVFDSIKKIRPKKLYISSDGPRINKEGERRKVELVRKIVTKIDWDCEVFTLFREENVGCKIAVSSAIDWFFSNEEMGIILEDDCLPHIDFYNFCNVLLNKYRNQNDIMSITGNNFQNNIVRGSASFYFSKYNHVWGWATWKRAWSKFNLNITFWPTWKKSEQWQNFITDKVERKYWEEIFDNTYNNKIDTWDYSWTASVWFNHGLTVTPNKNLVSNIGFGDDATHTTSTNNKFSNMATQSLGKITYPNEIKVDYNADKYVFDYAFNGRKLRYPYLIFVIIKRFLYRLTKR